jgi:phosphoglycerol transferase MdoB-like AlkP superfamily enzyme
VFGPDGTPLTGSDGVHLQWIAETADQPQPVTSLTLAPFAHPEQQRWLRVAVFTPPGAASLALEALPGPPGSNNWNDRLFVSVVRAENAIDLVAHPAGWLLLVLGLYATGVVVYAAVLGRPPGSLGPVTKAITLGGVLWLVLFVVRLITADAPNLECSTTAACVTALLAPSRHDSIYVGLIAALAVAAVHLFTGRPRAQQITLATFAALSLVSVCLSVLHPQIVRMLGGPFTYQWLYYSDFLGYTARTSLLSYVTGVSTATLALVVAGFSAAAFVGWRMADRHVAASPAAFASLAAMLGLGALLAPGGSAQGDDAFRAAWSNPMTSFVASLFGSKSPRLFTMDTEVGTEDFEPATATAPAIPAPTAGLRNVIVYVLESVAAEYVLSERADPTAIPEITRYRAQAVSFSNIYAHVPASNNSLVSILTSAYPLMSYESLTQVDPAAPLVSIASILRTRGYRTGYFSSADTRFQRRREFLAHHGFETLVGFDDMNCARERFYNSNPQWPFLDTYDDRCMLEVFLHWDGLGAASPFFAMLWPAQTHHPYFVAGSQRNWGVDVEDFNRYLNALHQTDDVFGALMRELEARGLADSTLVVVIGDHGEAFGQHDQWIHASAIYEENVRVPLLLVNRRVFEARTDETVGGLVDVAPTITGLLGVPTPGLWQGRSLFDANRSRRTYFFSPYSDILFGLREGNLKLLVNASANVNEVYDLTADPHETQNLAGLLPDFVRTGEERLAAWVQYQAAFYERLLQR